MNFSFLEGLFRECGLRESQWRRELSIYTISLVPLLLYIYRGHSLRRIAGASLGFSAVAMSLEAELQALLRDHRRLPQQAAAADLERELGLYRSDSAPPTVGSLSGRYPSNDDFNPKPAAAAREDWRPAAQRLGPGTIGDQRRAGAREGGAGSVAPNAGAERRASVQPNGFGTRRRSFADVVQGHVDHSTSIAGHPSHPTSHNTTDIVLDPVRVSDVQLTMLHNGLGTVDVHSEETSSGLNRVQSIGSSMPHSFTTTHGSYLSRSASLDPQLIGRYPSLCHPLIGGRMCNTNNIIGSNGFNGFPSCESDCSDMTAALSGLNLSKNVVADGEDYFQGLLRHEFANLHELPSNLSRDRHRHMHQKITEQSEDDPFNDSTVPLSSYNDFSKRSGFLKDTKFSRLTCNGQMNLLKQASSNIFCNGEVSTCLNTSSGFNGHYQNSDTVNIDFTGHNSLLSRQLDAGGAYPSRIGNQVGSGFRTPIMDPLYSQYLLRTDSATSPANNLYSSEDCLGASHMDLPEYQRTYIGALLAQKKLQHNKAFLSKYGGFNHGFDGSPPIGLGMPYPASPDSILSSMSLMRSLRQNGPQSSFHIARRGSTGGSMGSWNHENGIIENNVASSILEEVKSNKISFELSKIVDRVVDFSVDQYGSRFIQQKLETASLEEKNKIFPKILRHIHILMTDVFGNYVIQKFFEHGTESQIQQLAAELLGRVLPLSLQMYGCRVIQKALEVIDVDQRTQLVLELDGSVMKCVHDQNGNHVIQKCIECVPQDRIQFIISAFYGQVLALSTHPYGCRVIQRVLEYCDDADTQKIMMDEIMQSVCALAQDQYGNYVIQHVLQHGRPEERSFIISNLLGQIVNMSQQKFASNVVEKCLTYGTSEERQLLINEILGSTDENEPLQDVMKDQFGNYVVQKVLEICDDQNRELILSRIKRHLDTLKRYIYGKHIVARVEKLIATGERCSGISLCT